MSTGLSRREIEELLPWYAAGTLDPAERQAVEAALAGDADLLRQLALARAELDETTLDAERLGTPGPQAWTRLSALIEAEPQRRPANLTQGLAERLASWMSWRGLGFATAMMVIAAASGVISTQVLQDRGASFATASAPGATALDGRFVIVAFQPQATASAIATLLDRHAASIVDGPAPGGLYRLRIGARDMADAERDRIQAALKADAAVIRLVLPAAN